MPRHRWTVLAALAVYVLPAPSLAMEARTLATVCATKAFGCVEYLSGVVAGLEYAQRPKQFCLSRRFWLTQEPQPNDESDAILMLNNRFHGPPSFPDDPTDVEFIAKWLRQNYPC